MHSIPIYLAEKKDGIAEVISKSGVLSYATQLQINNDTIKKEPINLKTVATNGGQLDLYYLRSILVTTGWNLNEDVFDPKEVWAARSTPEDKPFNVGHNTTDIIGHITDVCPVDDEYKVIAGDTTVDDLPTKFHLLVNSVIYQCLQGEAQKRIDKIIGEIGEGKWYVSVEALFSDFDYALLYNDGSHKIVARNNDTAFLTKHLRCFGGTGLYQNAKVGRLMKHIIFSGKGLVERPANPESKIFANILSLNKSLGYIINSRDIYIGEKEMSVELETALKKALDENKELKVSLDKLSSQINQSNEKTLKDTIAQLEISLTTKSDLVEVLQKKLTVSAEETINLKKQLEEINTKLVDANKSLATFTVAKKKSDRAKVLAEAVKFTIADAESIVDTLISIADEDFNKFVEKQKELAKLITPTKTTAETVVEGAKPENDPNMNVAPTPDVEKIRKAMAAFLSDDNENTQEKQ